MGFCPYITARLLDSSVVDGTTTMYSYSVSQYDCPQDNTCQVWDSANGDCGSKNPGGAAAGPSPTSLLTEFLNKVDSDNLDLTPLGVSGEGIYGHDYMIEDEENIPIILKAAHDHPQWNVDAVTNRLEGSCDITISVPGYDSTTEWEYQIDITAFDGTNDLTTAAVTTSMYILIVDGTTIINSYQITSIDDSDTITLNLGYSDTEPLQEGSYDFIIDRKRITWDEYLGLFGG